MGRRRKAVLSEIVVDASAALGWFLHDEPESVATRSLALLETRTAVVPALWPIEIANALTVAMRRARITESELGKISSLLRALPVAVDETPVLGLFGEIIVLAQRHGISAYDATYLELALRLNAPLLTLDRELSAAAAQSGLPVA